MKLKYQTKITLRHLKYYGSFGEYRLLKCKRENNITYRYPDQGPVPQKPTNTNPRLGLPLNSFLNLWVISHYWNVIQTQITYNVQNSSLLGNVQQEKPSQFFPL